MVQRPSTCTRYINMHKQHCVFTIFNFRQTSRNRKTSTHLMPSVLCTDPRKSTCNSPKPTSYHFAWLATNDKLACQETAIYIQKTTASCQLWAATVLHQPKLPSNPIINIILLSFFYVFLILVQDRRKRSQRNLSETKLLKWLPFSNPMFWLLHITASVCPRIKELTWFFKKIT